ncbi:alkaline phosphatase family protein [Cnuibacter physcomitrellae]|uniref:alkaline phosphatase family protein n=1 Tax=Cnuibacter physcomitrellae TaxID=1619308 RepID=UPI002175E7AB|nr:alkaline phosphatase family protein [Cnuibacter physcomitrellae]MCS5496837.1 alkaline phosphatase family protein [Cnuibacter physcomitrellae]
MPPMLPMRDVSAPTLADVLPSCVAALRSEPNALALPSAERVLVILVDGLGMANLRARAGHARHLAAFATKRAVLTSGFPTTTAAALTTLMTGTLPGEHGIVGYTALVPATDAVVNQLSGWSETMAPDTWQRSETVFERVSADGIRCSTIGPARYADSGLTHAILRGAEYVVGESIEDRFAAARRLFDEGGRQLAYLYIPELDQAGHARGWESDRWTERLESVDRAFATFTSSLGRREGVLLSADHGVLDVPADRQILFGETPSLVDGVRHVGGDPRCVHLYLDADSSPDDAERLAAAWRDSQGDNAWVVTREEAVASGWFGEVAPEVLPRLGHVIVSAKRLVAYYRDARSEGRSMIGQHGSCTPEEQRVPLLRAGAFAQAG